MQRHKRIFKTSNDAKKFVENIEAETGIPVTIIGTGLKLMIL